MFSEDVRDSTSGNGMTQIRECTPDSSVSPAWIFSRHPHYQIGNLGDDGWSSVFLPPPPEVPLSRDELAVPSEDGVRRDNGRDLSEDFSTKGLSFYRKLSSLVVGQARSPTAVQVFEDALLFDQVVDHGLLTPVDPTSYSDDYQFPRLDCSAHEQGF